MGIMSACITISVGFIKPTDHCIKIATDHDVHVQVKVTI